MTRHGRRGFRRVGPRLPFLQERSSSSLDRLLEDNLVSFREYFRRRSELETRAIDQQLVAQRGALSVLDEEIRLASERGDAIADEEAKRARLVAEITALERQRGDVAVNARRAQAEAERDLAEQLDQVRIRLLEAQGSTAEARASQLEQEFEDLLARLQAEGDAEGEQLVRRLIDVELARARLTELEAEYQRTLQSLAREEQSIQAQVQTGTISEREGRRRIIELYQETADEVEALIPLMRELAAASGDPEAIERIKDLEAELERLRNTADRTLQEFRESVRDAGEGAFAAFISGDNVKQRAAELLFEELLERLFSIFGGAGGGVVGTVGGFLSEIFHEGGISGQGRRNRVVPKLPFAAAPRLHSGGLMPGERPAILQAGEEVLTRRDPRHRMNFGGGDVTVNIQTRDAESFSRRSPGQIGSDVANEVLRARNRNG